MKIISISFVIISIICFLIGIFTEAHHQIAIGIIAAIISIITYPIKDNHENAKI